MNPIVGSVWVTSSQEDSPINRSHMRVANHFKTPAYISGNFMVMYCHNRLWLIEPWTIGWVVGFEPQTLESAATCSVIWATMRNWEQNLILKEWRINCLVGGYMGNDKSGFRDCYKLQFKNKKRHEKWKMTQKKLTKRQI